MMKTRWYNQGLALVGSIILAAFFSAQAIAAADSGLYPTFQIKADGGFATYKSKVVQSNDTSTLIEYGFGVFAGSDKSLGMFVRRDQNTTTFVLNSSSITTVWQDVIVKYRWGPVYVGGILANNEMQVNNQGDANYLNELGSGYGVNAGLLIPIARVAYFGIDISDVSISKAVDLNQKVVTMGSRLDIDINGSFAITKKILDFIVGYKYRTYSATVDGTAGAENLTATYLGLSGNFFF